MARKMKVAQNETEGKFCVINRTAINRKWMKSYAEAEEHAKNQIETHDIDGELVVCRAISVVTRKQPIRVEKIK